MSAIFFSATPWLLALLGQKWLILRGNYIQKCGSLKSNGALLCVQAMRTASVLMMVSTLLCGAATAQAAGCSLEKAVYRTAEPKADYELTFAASELGGGSQMEAALSSKSLNVRLGGTVKWTNGLSRPIISLALPNSEESRYDDEIVALAVDAHKHITKIALPMTSKAAPKAILLNGISSNLYNLGRDEERDFDPELTSLQSDMFWLSGCDK